MPYKHITRDDRVELHALLKAGLPKTKIASQLGLDRSTIWREIRRNKGWKLNYDPRVAHPMACRRRRNANGRGNKIENNKKLRSYILKKLKLYWSPEQIAGRLKLENLDENICHETIYRYIYEKAPGLKKYLRQRKGKFRRRRGTKARTRERRGLKRRIDERPEIVDLRKRIGDWEGDTIVGGEKKTAILTHVDRKSGLLMADKLKRIHADYVRKVTVNRFNKISQNKRLTVTYDNGLSFAEHSITERETNMTVYFAHPYHSWERGTSENTNGLLRQFYPKKTLFRHLSQAELDKVVHLINNRPRKRLRYRTPQEVFSECCTSI